MRARFAERLLELALLIAVRNREEDGLRAARACVTAADRLADASIAPRDHPTMRAMFRRLIPAELMLKLGSTA